MRTTTILSALAICTLAGGALAAGTRSYTASTTRLRVNGTDAEILKDAAVTDTANPAGGTTSTATLTFVPTPGAPVGAWISETLAGTAKPRRFELVTLDYSYHVTSTEQFQNTTLSEIVFPTLEAASKDALYLKIKTAPTASSTKPGDNSAYPGAAGVKVKHLMSATFKVTIDSVATQYVSKVDAITATVPTLAPKPGVKEAVVAPAKVTLSPLAFTVATAHVATWQQWLAAPTPKAVSIAWLNPDMTTACTLTFEGVVPSKIETVQTAGADTIARSRIEAQPAKMRFTCP